jgi:hypothetical protein
MGRKPTTRTRPLGSIRVLMHCSIHRRVPVFNTNRANTDDGFRAQGPISKNFSSYWLDGTAGVPVAGVARIGGALGVSQQAVTRRLMVSGDFLSISP